MKKQVKRAIITADDFGIHHNANMAIQELFKKGVISQTVLMANMGMGTEEAIRIAKELQIPVGLHFNLTLGDDKIAERGQFETMLLLGKIDKKIVRQKLEEQYQFLVDQGITPTHIDSHQHIHNWPTIFKIVAKFAKEKNVPVRIPAEWPIYHLYQLLKPGDIKHIMRKYIFLVFTQINKLRNLFWRVKTNKKLVSFFALQPRPRKYEEKYLNLLLRRVGKGTEVMVHPIVNKEGMAGLTSIVDYSVDEYNLLRSPNFKEQLSKRNIELISYRDL